MTTIKELYIKSLTDADFIESINQNIDQIPHYELIKLTTFLIDELSEQGKCEIIWTVDYMKKECPTFFEKRPFEKMTKKELINEIFNGVEISQKHMKTMLAYSKIFLESCYIDYSRTKEKSTEEELRKWKIDKMWKLV